MIALGTNGGYPTQKVDCSRSPTPLWRATRDESPYAVILPFGLLDQGDHRRQVLARADDPDRSSDRLNAGPSSLPDRGSAALSRVQHAYPASGYSSNLVGSSFGAHAASLYQSGVPVPNNRTNTKSEVGFGTGLSSGSNQFENHEPFSREPTHSVQTASDAAGPESYVAYAASLHQGGEPDSDDSEEDRTNDMVEGGMVSFDKNHLILHHLEQTFDLSDIFPISSGPSVPKCFERRSLWPRTCRDPDSYQFKQSSIRIQG